MPDTKNKQEWKKYCARELTAVLPILEKLGFQLDREQPHLGGEKYLMLAVTTASGKKLVLLGRRKKDNKRVIIKVSSDPNGIREIQHERTRRAALQKISFAYQTFFSPQEILFTKHGKFTISIQEFLEHERPFTERPPQEQFFLALKAFKAQESAHATAYKHIKLIKKTFGSKNSRDYMRTFNTFKEYISKNLAAKEHLRALMEKAERFFQTHAETIEQYSGFLIHTDFVPHNFRIIGDKIYMLDHSSVRFGNKYEGWARFVNFMTLYNPALEQALVEYVRNNRTKEESLSLRLMRAYRLGELIYYYTNTLSKSSGNLLALNRARIDFWSRALEAILENKTLDKNVIEEYKKTRDSLRDEDEKQRQKNLY